MDCGDERAVEELLALTRTRLLATARRVAPPGEAEDCVQSAYHALFRQQAIPPNVPILGWLVTTVVRLGYRRRALRRRELTLADRLATPEPARSPQREAEHTEEADLLWHEIDRLPARYQHPLILHHLQGLSIAETAVALEITEGNVRVRLHRARGLLRARLAPRIAHGLIALPFLLFGRGSHAAGAGLLAVVIAAACLLGLTLGGDEGARDRSATDTPRPGATAAPAGEPPLPAPTAEDRVPARGDAPGAAASAGTSTPPAPDAVGPGVAPRPRPAQVSGVVLDPLGEPLAGAIVACARDLKEGKPGIDFRHMKPPLLPESAIRTTTDEHGRFELAGLPNGPVQICAVDRRHLPSELILTRVGGEEGLEDLELVLEPGLPLLGRVVDEHGAPVPGATLGAFVVPAALGELNHATSDPAGQFSLEGLVPEVLHGITVVATRADGQGLALADARFASRSFLPGTDDIELRLAPSASVTGTLVDGHGEGIASAEIVLLAAEGIILAPVRRTAARADGTFAFLHLPPGGYQLSCYLEQAHSQIDLELSPGEIREQQLVLAPRQGLAIRGRVATTSGDPIAGVGIVATSAEGAAYAATDAGGAFALEGLAAGDYRLEVRSDRHRLAAGQPRPLTAKAGSTLEITLERAAVLRGRVTDGKGAAVRPFTVAGVLREVFLPDEMAFLNPVTFETEDGSFELAPLPQAALAIDVGSPDHASQRILLPARGPAGGDLDLGDINLTAGRPLDGTVQTSGLPIDGATVVLAPTTERSIDSRALRPDPGVKTDETGRFRFPRVASGSYRLRVSHPELMPHEEVLEVPGGSPGTPLVVELHQGAGIEGMTRLADGSPQAAVAIEVRADVEGRGGTEPPRAWKATSDADGTYRIAGLPPGEYVVRASDPRFRARAGSGASSVEPATIRIKRVSVTGRDFVECSFGGEEACLLRGRVVGWSGTGSGRDDPSHLDLEIRGPQGSAGTQVEPDGSFEIAGVQPGRYRLDLRDEVDLVAQPLEIPAGGEHTVELVMPTGCVTGRVVRADGGSLAGARAAAARLVNGRWRLVADTRCDADGAFTISHLSQGIHQIAGSVPGCGRAILEGIDVPAGGMSPDLVIELAATGTLLVEVLDAEGAPCPQCIVQIRRDEGSSSVGSKSIDRPGRWTLHSVVAGRYQVLAGAPGLGTSWVKDVEVVAGAERTVQVTLGRFRGRFAAQVTRDGLPVRNARIVLRDAAGQAVPDLGRAGITTLHFTDSSGRYESSPFPGGPYVLEVSVDGAEQSLPVVIPDDGGMAEVRVEL